jgi:hypothetical protein
LKLGPLGAIAFLEMLDFRVDFVERRGGFPGFVVGALELFFLDLPLELEAPKVAEERAFFGGEAIGFFVQDAKTLGGARRESFSPRLIGLLREDGHRATQQNRDEGGRLHKSFVGAKL